MSSTLNEKIKHFLDAFDRYDEYSWNDKQEAADKLEKLILQEKIDSLNQVMGNNTWDDDQSATFKTEISALTKQLNQSN